jgi:hypothetical protein
MRVLYGALADELVMRFGSSRGHGEIVVPVTTPNVDYAGLLVAAESGAVLGVHVYPLLAFAIQRHPAWRAAADPIPGPEVANLIVTDIKGVFDRHGVEDLDEER